MTSAESANSQNVFAVLSTGRVLSWGVNLYGSAGVGSSAQTVSNFAAFSPMYVNLPVDLRFVSVTAANGYACFVTDGGSVYCSGSNTAKQIGRTTLAAPFT